MDFAQASGESTDSTLNPPVPYTSSEEENLDEYSSQSSISQDQSHSRNSARAREKTIKEQLESAKNSSGTFETVNYMKVALERVDLPQHVRELFELYGITALNDLLSVDGDMLLEIEKCVTENSLPGANFDVPADRLKYLGTEEQSAVYKLKPFTKIKILKKLPDVISAVMKEKKELNTFQASLRAGPTTGNKFQNELKKAAKRTSYDSAFEATSSNSSSTIQPIKKRRQKRPGKRRLNINLKTESSSFSNQEFSEDLTDDEESEDKFEDELSVQVKNSRTTTRDLENIAASIATSALERINSFWKVSKVKGEILDILRLVLRSSLMPSFMFLF